MPISTVKGQIRPFLNQNQRDRISLKNTVQEMMLLTPTTLMSLIKAILVIFAGVIIVAAVYLLIGWIFLVSILVNIFLLL